MRKQQKSMLVLAVMAGCMAMAMFLPGLIGAGELEPPAGAVDESGAPVPTMHTLEEIYNKLNAIAADVFEIKMRTACQPDWRFCELGDGTVWDRDTGLIWLKNANCLGYKNWSNAMGAAAVLADGQCGLTDGSVAGDWRLPTKEDLEGLGTNPPTTWDSGYPPVPWTMPGSPFENVQSAGHWASTEYAASSAWGVYMPNGVVGDTTKGTLYYVWPVRGGN